MCIKLTDVHTDDEYLYACLSMEVQINGLTVIIFNFDCAKLGQNGITLVKPTPKTPTDGQFDVNLSLSNLEEALKNKSATTTTKSPIGWPNFFQANINP
jgi:hypothetical protein